MKLRDNPNGDKDLYNAANYPSSGIYKNNTGGVLVVDKERFMVMSFIGTAAFQAFLNDNNINAVPSTPASNITANDMLKAIAISQKPELATTLLHPSMQ